MRAVFILLLFTGIAPPSARATAQASSESGACVIARTTKSAEAIRRYCGGVQSRPAPARTKSEASTDTTGLVWETARPWSVSYRTAAGLWKQTNILYTTEEYAVGGAHRACILDRFPGTVVTASRAHYRNQTRRQFSCSGGKGQEVGR